MKWTEQTIGRALCRQTCNRSALVLVPNCNWTGYECDVLIVEKGLRVIDVEVKISRADLKADAKKDKWWHREFKGYGPETEDLDATGRLIRRRWNPIYEVTARPWPPKVWKHYYAMPKAIWSPELIDCVPANSGILLLSEPQAMDRVEVVVRVIRPPKPNRDADKLAPAAVLDIARLANLRMWEAYGKLEAGR